MYVLYNFHQYTTKSCFFYNSIYLKIYVQVHIFIYTSFTRHIQPKNLKRLNTSPMRRCSVLWLEEALQRLEDINNHSKVANLKAGEEACMSLRNNTHL